MSWCVQVPEKNGTQIFRNFKCGHFNWRLVNWKKKHAVKNDKCSSALLFLIISALANSSWFLLFFLKHLIGNVLCFTASQDIVALSEQHYPFFFFFLSFFFSSISSRRYCSVWGWGSIPEGGQAIGATACLRKEKWQLDIPVGVSLPFQKPNCWILIGSELQDTNYPSIHNSVRSRCVLQPQPRTKVTLTPRWFPNTFRVVFLFFFCSLI